MAENDIENKIVNNGDIANAGMLENKQDEAKDNYNAAIGAEEEFDFDKRLAEMHSRVEQSEKAQMQPKTQPKVEPQGNTQGQIQGQQQVKTEQPQAAPQQQKTTTSSVEEDSALLPGVTVTYNKETGKTSGSVSGASTAASTKQEDFRRINDSTIQSTSTGDVYHYNGSELVSIDRANGDKEWYEMGDDGKPVLTRTDEALIYPGYQGDGDVGTTVFSGSKFVDTGVFDNSALTKWRVSRRWVTKELPKPKDYSGYSLEQLEAENRRLESMAQGSDEDGMDRLANEQNAITKEIVAKKAGFPSWAVAISNKGEFDYLLKRDTYAKSFPCKYSSAMASGSIFNDASLREKILDPLGEYMYGSKMLTAQMAYEADEAAGTLKSNNNYINFIFKDPNVYNEFVTLCCAKAKIVNKSVDAVIKEEINKYASHVSGVREDIRAGRVEYLKKALGLDSPWEAIMVNMCANNFVGKMLRACALDKKTNSYIDEAISTSIRERAFEIGGFWGGMYQAAAEVSPVIPDALTLMPGIGKSLGWGLGKIAGKEWLVTLEGRMITGALNFGTLNVANLYADSAIRGEAPSGAEVACAFSKGVILSTIAGGAGSTVSNMFPYATKKLTATGVKALSLGTEVSVFAGDELMEKYLRGEKITGKDVAVAYTNSGFMVFSFKTLGAMTKALESSAEPISDSSIKAVKDAGYDALANDLNIYSTAVRKGSTPAEMWTASKEDFRRFVNDHESGKSNTTWEQVAEVGRAAGVAVPMPGEASSDVVERDGKTYIETYDNNGLTVRRIEAKSKKEANKINGDLTKIIDVRKEAANEESFNQSRDYFIKMKVAREFADSENEQNGEKLYKEDGSVNEDFRGLTAVDVIGAFNHAYAKEPSARTSDEQMLVDTFLNKMYETGSKFPTVESFKESVCKQYNISVEDFDKAWNTRPENRQEGPATEACRAYNKIMADGYAPYSGERAGTAVINGKKCDIVDRVEVKDGVAANPEARLRYIEDGKVKITKAGEAAEIVLDPDKDRGDVISLTNRQNDMIQAYREFENNFREAMKDESDEALEKSISVMEKQIADGEDITGRLRVMVDMQKELLSERARDRKGEEQHFKEHPLELSKELYGDKEKEDKETQTGDEGKNDNTDVPLVDGEDDTKSDDVPLVDGEGSDATGTDPEVERRQRIAQAFAEGYFGEGKVPEGWVKTMVDNPAEFNRFVGEVEQTANVSPDSDAARGMEAYRKALEAEGEGKDVNKGQGTASAAEGDLFEILGIPEEYRDGWQKYWEQNPPKDAIDVLLDRMDVTDETQRAEMRKSYEENHEFFQKEWDEWNSGISIADVERALGLEPAARENVRTDGVKDKKETTPAKEPVESPKPENNEKPFHSYTLKSGKKVEWRTQTEEKDGVKVTRVVATADGKEVSVPAARFPMPKEYEIDKDSMPEDFDGKVEGVKELRETSEGATATIVVSNRDGSIDEYEVRLNKKSEFPKPENKMQPAKVEKKGPEEKGKPDDKKADEIKEETEEVASDKIEELLDKKGLTEEGPREEMRKLYKENPDFFKEEYEREFGKKPEAPAKKAETPRKEEPRKEEPRKSGMPMKDEDGERVPDFEKANSKQIHDHLYNDGEYTEKEADTMIKNELEDAAAEVAEKKAALEKAQEEYEEKMKLEPKTRLTTKTVRQNRAEKRDIEAQQAEAKKKVDTAMEELDKATSNQIKWEKVKERADEAKAQKNAPKAERPEPKQEKAPEPKQGKTPEPKQEPKQEGKPEEKQEPKQPKAEAPKKTEKPSEDKKEDNTAHGIQEEDAEEWKKIGEETDSKDAIDQIDKMAKKLGLKIKIYDGPEDINGFQRNGTIYVNRKAKTKGEGENRGREMISFVVGHEATHEMQNRSEEKRSNVYREYKEAANEWLRRQLGDEAYEKEVADKLAAYKDHFAMKAYNEVLDSGGSMDEAVYAGKQAGDLITRDYVEDEMAADATGRLIENPERMREMFQDRRDLSKARRIVAALRDVLDALIALGSGEKRRYIAARDKFNDMYNELLGEEISRNDGSSIEGADHDMTSRNSMSSMAEGAGLEAKVAEKTGFTDQIGRETDNWRPITDSEGNMIFKLGDKEFSYKNPIKVEDLKSMEGKDGELPKSALSAMVTDALRSGTVTREQADRIYKNYADMLNKFLEIGKGDALKAVNNWQFVADTVYRTVATNSDAQYAKSIDITRVCKKNEAVIRSISEQQLQQGYGITPGQILDLYYNTKEYGYQVPCPVCYVFSRYIRNGKYASAAVNGMELYGDHMLNGSDPWSAERWLKEIETIEAETEKYEEQYKAADTDVIEIPKQIDDLRKRYDSVTSKKVRAQIQREIDKLDKRYREAVKIWSSANLKNWIKAFAIEKKNKQWRVREDALKPDDMADFRNHAMDLRITSQTMEKYPGIQRIRKSAGAAGGKEITFPANNEIGELISGLSIASPTSKYYNPYHEAFKTTDMKERARHLKEASKKFEAAKEYVRKQNLRGGVRMWSWSDNLERLSPDVMSNLMQLELLGGGVQSYSKQLEGIEMVAASGAYVNGSLMAKDNGYMEVGDYKTKMENGIEVLAEPIKETVEQILPGGKRQPRERIIADVGSRVTVQEGKRVVAIFDDVVGIDPHDYGKKTGLFSLCNKYDRAGNIIVGMNDTHIRTVLADPRIKFCIPWHSSGANNHILRQTLEMLGQDTENFKATDYTKMQEEHRYVGRKRISADVREFWESRKNEKDFACGIEGGVDSSRATLSASQLHYRTLREMIFGGGLEEAKNGVKPSEAEYSAAKEEKARLEKEMKKVQRDKSLEDKDREKALEPIEKDLAKAEHVIHLYEVDAAKALEEIKADVFLNQVYETVKNDADGKMTAGDNKYVYPYEYWDKSVGEKDADINGKRYIEYCRRLGIRPKFSGNWKSKSKDGRDVGNFVDDEGYWKLLIDRRMYDREGKFQDMSPIDSSGFKTDFIDPAKTREKYNVTEVANDEANKEIVRRSIEQERRRLGGQNAVVTPGVFLEEAITGKPSVRRRKSGNLPAYPEGRLSIGKGSGTHFDKIAEDYADEERLSIDARAFKGDSEFEKAVNEYNETVRMNKRRAEREGKDYYPTPAPLALITSRILNSGEGMDVLDIGSGDGMLHKFIKNGNVTAVESSPTLAEQNRKNTGANVINADYLELEDGKKYPRIVLNPPYGNKGTEAFKHVNKGYEALEDGGRMVAILPMGKNADSLYNDFVSKVESDGSRVTANIELPSCTFYKAGIHGSRTRMVVVDKGVTGETNRVDLSDARTNQELYERLHDINVDEDGKVSGVVNNAGVKYSIGKDVAERDREFAEAVAKGDKEKAQRMLEEEADRKLNETLKLPDDSNEMGFKYHRGPAPKKTRSMYAVLNVSPEGLKAAYAGNKTSNPIGVWLDAVPIKSYPSDVAKNDDGSPSRYIPGDTGKSWNTIFSEETYAKMMEENPDITKSTKWLYERGGKHGTDVPNFGQMNVKDSANKGTPEENVRTSLPHNKLIFEIECGMDENGDLTEYVKENGRFVKGKNQGLPWVGENKFYFFKTNPNASGNWGIAGTFRIKRLVPYEEVVSETQKANERIKVENERISQENQGKPKNQQKKLIKEIPLQRWVGGYKPEDSGITVEGIDALYKEGKQKKLMEPTYDDNGNLIPLSQRFNTGVDDARYSIGKDVARRDKEFADAVARGDREKVAELVQKAAEESMPDTKVVDEDGKPMVVYHASRYGNEFTVFNTSPEFNGMNYGSHFGTKKAAEDISVGEPYAKTYAVYLDIKNPMEVDDYFADDNSYWADLLVRLVNEHKIDDPKINAVVADVKEKWPWVGKEDAFTNGDYDVQREESPYQLVEMPELYKAVRDVAERLGYDGFVYENLMEDAGSDSYVAFRPNQIKSAEPVTRDDKGNVIPLSERFNPGKDDIRYSIGGERLSLQSDYASKLRELIERRRNGEDVSDELRQLNEDYDRGRQNAATNFSAAEDQEHVNRSVRRVEQEAQREENKAAAAEDREPMQIPRAHLPVTGYETPQGAVSYAQAAQIRAVMNGESSRETRDIAKRQMTDNLRKMHRQVSNLASKMEEIDAIKEELRNFKSTYDPSMTQEQREEYSRQRAEIEERLNKAFGDGRFWKGFGKLAEFDEANKGMWTTKAVEAVTKAQRDYDHAVVSEVVNLAKTYADLGLLDEASLGKVKQMFTAIKNASENKSPAALYNAANRLLDITLDVQATSIRNQIKKLLSTPAAKVGAKGVTEGKMDVHGQIAMSELNNYFGKGYQEISNHINALNGMLAATKDSTEKAHLKAQIEGAEIARDYANRAMAFDSNLAELDNAMAADKRSYERGEMTAAEYRSLKKACEEDRRRMVIDQTRMLWDSVDDIRNLVERGKEGGRTFREIQQKHAEDVLHDAYRDTEKMDASTQQRQKGFKSKAASNAISKYMSSSLATLETMLRDLGRKSVNGEGNLFNRFAHGQVTCSENEWKEWRRDCDTLDAKAQEIFGRRRFAWVGEGVRFFTDINRIIKGLPKMDVEYMDGGRKQMHTLDQGQLMYIYMVNKMSDGAVKLRRMGISEDAVNQIAAHLDSGLKKMADWLQTDFLPKKQKEYNKTHERVFGAPLADIENYFPLKIDVNTLPADVDVANLTLDINLNSTTTSGVKVRTQNTAALDIMNSNAIDVLIKHVQEMGHWNNFVEWNRDANTLLSDPLFRNRVRNMKSLYGTGDDLLKKLENAFAMGSGTYQERTDGTESAAVNIARGVSAAKVAFRPFTAMKQALSLPAFAPNVSFAAAAKATATPLGCWNWCMDNLPLFEKRWKGRRAGDTRLQDTELDWNWTKKNIVQTAARMGMKPNAFIDALTVAIGTKATYDTRFKKYKSMGYDDAKAAEKAKMDATIAFNQSQQSSEGLFTSTLQQNRTWGSVALSVFRNSSMGFERRFAESLRTAKKLTKGAFNSGYRKEMQNFMADIMKRDGLTDTQAERAAKRIYRREIWRTMLNFVTFGVGVEFMWNVGGQLPGLMYGIYNGIANDDWDRATDILADAGGHALFGGVEGLPAGNVISDNLHGLCKAIASGDNFKSRDFTLMPIVSDAEQTLNKITNAPWDAATDFFNILAQSSVGVNPQVFTDAGVAILDACNGDFGTATEAVICAERIFQVPQSQIENMWVDELNMGMKDARKLSLDQIARRYAYYKMKKSAPGLWRLYSDEQEQKLVEKYEKKFKKKLGEDIAEDEQSADAYLTVYNTATSNKTRESNLDKLAKALEEEKNPAHVMDIMEEEHRKYMRPKGNTVARGALLKRLSTVYNNIVNGKKEKEEKDGNSLESWTDYDIDDKAPRIFNPQQYVSYSKLYGLEKKGRESEAVDTFMKLGGTRSIAKKRPDWDGKHQKAGAYYREHKKEIDDYFKIYFIKEANLAPLVKKLTGDKATDAEVWKKINDILANWEKEDFVPYESQKEKKK